MATTRAAEANDWEFLDPWFKVLKDLIHVADPERYDTLGAVGMGRDPETDWWLDIDWSRHLLVASQLQIETTLKTIREALLLTSALASIDNKLWLLKLRDLCGFVPATFMDFSAHALHPNFQFRLQRRHPMINVDWDKTMKFLCGCEGFTKEFYRFMKRAARLGAGCDIRRPRLQLHVSVPPEPGSTIRPRPPPEAHDISFLVLLEATIQHIQATNRLEVERPHFVLHSLYLDMGTLIEHSQALAVLQRIVTLGVPIDTLRLPHLSRVLGNRPSSEWRESWVSFMGALCNHSPTNEPQRVAVGRLWIGRQEVVDPDFTIFCSALMRADNIRMLQIGEDVDDPDEEVDSFPPGVWDLIALTMLSCNSSRAIRSLAIYRVTLTEEDVEAVLDMMGVVNPLYEYFVDWAPGVRVQRGGKITHGVRIPAGSTLSSEYGFDEQASYSITTDTDIDAIVLHEDGNDVHVFMDVRGLCTVARDALPAKRSRITMGNEQLTAEGELDVEARLESLELTSVHRDTTTKAQLPLFVEYAGGKRLKSLRVKVPQLDAATVKKSAFCVSKSPASQCLPRHAEDNGGDQERHRHGCTAAITRAG